MGETEKLQEYPIEWTRGWKRYGYSIMATSREDAEDHLEAIKLTGKVIGGPIEVSIPVYPGAGILARIVCWISNLFSLKKTS